MSRNASSLVLVCAFFSYGCGTANEVPSPAPLPFAAACQGRPGAPAEYLTSNMVMPPNQATGTPANEPVGVLRSFLEDSPGVTRELVDAKAGDASVALEVFTLPVGTALFKALAIPKSGLTAQEDILNPYATSTNWYSSRAVAESYANTSWGKEQGFKLVKFAARRDLTLVNLANVNNLGYIAAKLDDDIAYYQGELATYSAMLPADSAAVALLQVTLDGLVRDQKILELTTGFKATYEEQLAMLVELGSTPTFNSEWPGYSPANEIAKRNIKGTDTFGLETAGQADSWKPVTLLTGCEAEPETLVRWGGGAEDLNRISFTTALDKELTRIIERKLNVDGYFSPPAPSLFHGSGRLVEEVGVFDPGASTTIVEILDAVLSP